MALNLKQTSIVAGGLAVLVAALLGGATYFSAEADRLTQESAARRYQSYLLADELRQSSDDLTRLARTYVISGDARWEQQYLEILAIRDGKQARPQSYERIYWDFRAAGVDAPRPAGEAAPLDALMKKAGFSAAEFGKLAEAKANSDALVRAETEAMNMVKGLYDDGRGGYTRKGEPNRLKAAEMLHDLSYHQYKAKIMKPVDDFLQLLAARTEAELLAATAVQRRWALAQQALVATLVLTILGSLMLIRRRSLRVLNDVEQVANGIADGDVSQPTKAGYSGDEGRVMSTLDRMQKKLATIVAEIRSGADSVATASNQIAQGNADLSQRTEQQAGSLQQTASTMDELGTTVRHNADSARQADQLARNASEVAVQGGAVVGQVVTTMKGISDNSRKVADIIGVIDGIAFQTNILALNAAVEAARAGEQGRGFAVVAGEVRTLAQRSAEAARAITGLITASVEQVEHGAALADKAGTTMLDVVSAIQRVTEIAGEISAASAEQSQGVNLVGEAVAQMDQATQQNAAVVEESAAAASSLAEQAQKLAQSVAVFKLADGLGVPAPAARRGTGAGVGSVARAATVTASRPALKHPAPRPAVAKPAVTAGGTATAAAPAAHATADAEGDWATF